MNLNQRAVIAFLLALSSLGCGTPSVSSTPAVHQQTAHIRFGARTPLSSGLSASETWRDARFVEVISRDPDGHQRERGQTDAHGRVTMDVAAGGSLVIVTRFTRDEIETWISSDANGNVPHEHAVLAAGDGSTMAIDLADDQPIAGALHLLDTLAHGLETFRAWRSVTLPPIFAHWGRGETTDWSYFLGQVPEGSGRFGLVLMGGEPGAQATTDTDEHDEGIVLHELGHFVMSRRSGDSSIGGRHPPGTLTEPGVAWEEGRATFFAVAALASSGLSMEHRYRDTIGIEPTGSCRVDQDVETPAASNPRGPGVQESVTAILWDLADGAGPGIPADAQIPDSDDDGVALGAGGVMEAMQAQWAEPNTYPGLASFLEFLIRTGRVERGDLEAMLARTGEPSSHLAPSSRWPIDAAWGVDVAGRIDGVTEPAPSGGEARPGNGLDAVRAYRVVVERAGLLEARVNIDGSGTATDQTQVTLELRDRRATRLAHTTSDGAMARVSQRVQPGTYVIYARSTEEGSRASFTLRATLTE